MAHTHTATAPVGWDKAVRRIREAIASQWFRALSEIAVRATFAAKFGTKAAKTVGDYLICGACTPAVQDIANDAGTRLRATLASIASAEPKRSGRSAGAATEAIYSHCRHQTTIGRGAG